MRDIVGTRSDFANITWPANPNTTLIYVANAFIGCVIGVPANLTVLLLSFLSTEVQGNYKYFIANLAFFDLSYCFGIALQCALHLYQRFSSAPVNAVLCTLEESIPYSAGLCAGCAIPLASINRYLVIVKGKDVWFTKKIIILMCMTALLPILYPITTFSFAQYVVYYPYCNYTLHIPFGIEPFFVYIIAICYPLIMFCNYGIYKVLKQHSSVVKKSLNRSMEQIQNERSILKAIIIQGALPVVTAFPIGMVFVGVFFFSWKQVTFKIFELADGLALTSTDLCFTVFVLTPTIDALITLLVVKQYRSALHRLMMKIRCGIFGCSESSVTPSVESLNQAVA